jgi:NAD(P)-dependent dehydrogenase (short-subunit alcohol dehydrogenase family)
MQDKVALVTGGTSGIGRATAIAFAKQGAKVVIAGRRQHEGEETLQMVKAAGSDGLFIRADVSDEAQVQDMVDKTVAKFGRLDYAFNNAGTEGQPGPFTEQTVANYDRIMDINVKGLFLSMKHEIAQMLKNGGGAIVNNASIAGLIGFPGLSVYSASKHAVLGLTKTAALEFAKSNIRINAVNPGAIQTDMVDRFTGAGPEGMKDTLASFHPVGRIGTADEVASGVVYLCSEGASFITGQSLTIDGGFTAQ